MFNRRSFLPLVIASALIGSSPYLTQSSLAQEGRRELASARSPASLQAIYRKLDEITVPDKTFTATSARDVLAFLVSASSSSGGSRGVSTSATFRNPMPTITVHWKRLTWRQALDDFCQQADMYWRIDDKAIAIMFERP